MQFFNQYDATILFGAKILEIDSDVEAPGPSGFLQHPVYLQEPLLIPAQHECHVVVRNLRSTKSKSVSHE